MKLQIGSNLGTDTLITSAIQGVAEVIKVSVPKLDRTAFSLVELLVVIAIISLLTSILLPSLAAAKELAKISRVVMELRGIDTALELYAEENNETYPPTRTYCHADMWRRSCELPVELVEAGLLPEFMEDIFNPLYTYKYKKPGVGMHNDSSVIKSLWIPDAFPNDDAGADASTLEGKSYNNTWQPTDTRGKVIPCPVRWVIWSVGPGYNPNVGSPHRAPVPRCSWYKGRGGGGVIPLIKTTEGNQIGYWR